jgi:hypothetical protein
MCGDARDATRAATLKCSLAALSGLRRLLTASEIAAPFCERQHRHEGGSRWDRFYRSPKHRKHGGRLSLS